MAQETKIYEVPRASTIFGVGAMFYAALAVVAAITVASASTVGDVVSGVIVGAIFLAVAGVSTRLALGSRDWPDAVELVRTRGRRPRIVRVVEMQRDLEKAA